MQFVTFRDKINIAAVLVMAFSLFGFLGNVTIDYNWGTNVVTTSIAVFYWLTLKRIIPFPLNYWGVGAFVYFILFLISFAVLNRANPLKQDLLETVRLASSILILFELGVLFFVPNFMNKWVVQALHGTALAGFTNWDLLATAALSLTISQYLMAKSHTRDTSSAFVGK